MRKLNKLENRAIRWCINERSNRQRQAERGAQRSLQTQTGMNRNTSELKRRKLVERLINRLGSDAIRQELKHEQLWHKASFINRFDEWTNISEPELNTTNNSTANNIKNLEQLEQIANEKFPRERRECVTKLAKLYQLNLMQPTKIRDRELELAIIDARKKRYTGPDGVK